MTINRFVLVELGCSQKYPTRSPNKTYIPLQVSAPVAGLSTVVTLPSTSSHVNFDEGTERVVIGEHNTSLSPGQFVILDFYEPYKEKDPDTEKDPSVCEVAPLVPNLSLPGIRDPTIQGSLENFVTPTVHLQSSPHFYRARKKSHLGLRHQR